MLGAVGCVDMLSDSGGLRGADVGVGSVDGGGMAAFGNGL